MPILLADEDFDHRVVRLLREVGHDIITLQDLGLAGLAIPDEQVLAIAIALKRGVLTFNRKDFIKLHREYPLHFGIIICTRNSDVKALSTKLETLLENADRLNGRLLRIYRN